MFDNLVAANSKNRDQAEDFIKSLKPAQFEGADTREVTPDAVLLPMNGWDAGGYRLGYGGGFFDRTLAAAAKRPLVIGVTYELARMETIHPQPWDIPVDWVVTEAGAYRRNEAGRLAKAA